MDITPDGKAINVEEAFCKFMSTEVLDIIINNTNEHITEENDKIDEIDLLAFM